MSLLFSSIEIIALLGLIVASCALFTNAIEWVGHRFNLSEGAVGSVLAAVGTALPETLVPVIAIMSGVLGVSGLSAESGHQIGIGAILGAPFLLSTLAMFVTAFALFYFAATKKRSVQLNINLKLFRRDFHYFFVAYTTVFLAAFIPDQTIKAWLSFSLLGFYGIYVYRTLKQEHSENETEDLPQLFFWRKKAFEPSTWMIITQLIVSLLLLLLMVHFFVEQIQFVATALNVPPLLLSLIITPIATELPEKFNSVVWIQGKKDSLAFGNLTGAMVFQSCIPTAIGISFTPWVLNGEGLLSVALCMISSLCVYIAAWKKPHMLPLTLFMAGGIFYLIFLLSAIFAPIS